jgi:hypothetical protein
MSLKAILPLILVLFSFRPMNSQYSIDDRLNSTYTPFESKNSATRRAFYANWKRPGRAIFDVYRNINFYVEVLFPDSTVKTIFPSGKNVNVSEHAVGAVFDPTDPIFSLYDDKVRLSRYDNYTVDSLALNYLYIRNRDSVDLGNGNEEVVDTLIIQFFTKDQLSFEILDSNSGEIYAKPAAYSPSIIGSPDFEYRVKIPLKGEHATKPPSGTDYETDWWTIPIPDINISENPLLDGSNVCGYLMTFKTMLDYAPGDTLNALNGAIVTKKLNYFGYGYLANNGNPIKQLDHYNNAVFVTKHVRYGDEHNGFNGYIPGEANGSVYLSYGIHFKTNDLDNTRDIDALDFTIYPNPVSLTGSLKLDLNLDRPSDASVSIIDDLGRIITYKKLGIIEPGMETITLDLDRLSSGSYFLQLTTDTGSFRKKLLVQ